MSKPTREWMEETIAGYENCADIEPGVVVRLYVEPARIAACLRWMLDAAPLLEDSYTALRVYEIESDGETRGPLTVALHSLLASQPWEDEA